MSADVRQDEFGTHENVWVPDRPGNIDPVAARSRALAHATLVQTSMKVLNVRAAAQSTLLEAHTQSEEMLSAAEAEAAATVAAASIRAGETVAAAGARAEVICAVAQARSDAVLAEARRNANAITDRALDQRDMLLTATLERIAELSTRLMGMADQIVVHAEEPAVARAQLAQFMLSLTDMAEQIDGEDTAASFDAVEPLLDGVAA